MHDVTARRLLVFGVCAAGVASLHVVPGIARNPPQAAAPRPHHEPSARPSGTVREVSVPTSGRPGPSTSEATAEDDLSAADSTRTGDADDAAAGQPAQSERSTAAPHPRPSRTGATAFDPAETRDDEAPEAVAGITSATVSPARLTVRWPAAADNIGVVEYRVVLDGYQVATTPRTSASVRWFNDDARDHVVHVKAVDAAGNESASSPNLLVARPTPGPSPSTTEPSADPFEPTPVPEPTPEPTPRPWKPTTAPSQDDPREDLARDAEPLPSPTDEET